MNLLKSGREPSYDIFYYSGSADTDTDTDLYSTWIIWLCT